MARAEIAIGGGQFGIVGEIDVAIVAFVGFVAPVVIAAITITISPLVAVVVVAAACRTTIVKTAFAVAEFSLSVAGAAVVVTAVFAFVFVVVVETFAREIAFAAVAESSFFAHAAQFVVGFHHIALRAEIVEFAFEGDIFAEFAIERSVL